MFVLTTLSLHASISESNIQKVAIVEFFTNYELSSKTNTYALKKKKKTDVALTGLFLTL